MQNEQYLPKPWKEIRSWQGIGATYSNTSTERPRPSSYYCYYLALTKQKSNLDYVEDHGDFFDNVRIAENLK